jgi:hypothetical protein
MLSGEYRAVKLLPSTPGSLDSTRLHTHVQFATYDGLNARWIPFGSGARGCAGAVLRPAPHPVVHWPRRIGEPPQGLGRTCSIEVQEPATV